MRQSIGVDDAKFDLAMRQFADNLSKLERATNKTAGQLLWKYSTRFAAALVAKTRPIAEATGKGSKRVVTREGVDRGMAAVQRDIRKVYMSPGTLWKEIESHHGDKYSAYFWHLYKTGQKAKMESWLRSIGWKFVSVMAWDGGRKHAAEKLRLIKSGKHTPNRALVIDDGNVKEYIRKIQSHVMWAKAGWISNFNPPGGVGKGGWPDSVKRHRSAPGRVVDKTKGFGPEKAIIFENHVPYAAYLFSWRMARSTVTFVGQEMARDLEKAISKIGNSQSAAA